MVIFHSYVSLPEGRRFAVSEVFGHGLTRYHGASLRHSAASAKPYPVGSHEGSGDSENDAVKWCENDGKIIGKRFFFF